jgi:DNA-binding transcriptional MerR regulator
MSEFRVMSISDVAERLNVSKRWLSDWLKTQNIGKKAGRARLFVEADLVEIYRGLPQCHSKYIRPERANRKTTGYAARSMEQELISLQEQIAKSRQRKNAERLSATSNVIAITQKAK